MPNPAKAERADVVATVVSVIIVIVAAVGGSLLLWAGREQLPEMVATHWGPAGRADAFKPTARLYVENAELSA